jgi:hypothetical protein
MNFNKHSDLVGEHAFLSASKYHWTNYNEDKIAAAYTKFLAAQKGVELHDFARRCIDLGMRLPKSKKSINCFVNDAIGYRMKTEQPLVYSENSFGTADAISFRDNILRIHDLKTGESAVSIRQLEVYAALFCLEYDEKPNEINIQLRIYQSDDIVIQNSEAQDIQDIMNKIVSFNRILNMIKLEREE